MFYFNAAGPQVVHTAATIQPLLNAFLFDATKQGRLTIVTTSNADIWRGGLSKLLHCKATQSTVITCTNSSVLKIPIIAATPQPSTIGVTHQILNTDVLSLPSNVSTLSQPLTVSKSKAPQPKKSQNLLFNQPKVMPRSKSRQQTYGGW